MDPRSCRRIETTRLVLSPHKPEDIEDCIRMWSDPAVIRMIRTQPFSAEETWARVLRYAGHWDFTGIGYWTIRHRDDGRFFGELGFAFTRRALPEPFAGMAEFACTLARNGWGRGIGQEATLAALEWLDTFAGITDTVAITDQANRAALALADAVGYRPMDRITFNERPFTILARMANPPP